MKLNGHKLEFIDIHDSKLIFKRAGRPVQVYDYETQTISTYQETLDTKYFLSLKASTCQQYFFDEELSKIKFLNLAHPQASPIEVSLGGHIKTSWTQNPVIFESSNGKYLFAMIEDRAAKLTEKLRIVVFDTTNGKVVDGKVFYNKSPLIKDASALFYDEESRQLVTGHESGLIRIWE